MLLKRLAAVTQVVAVATAVVTAAGVDCHSQLVAVLEKFAAE